MVKCYEEIDDGDALGMPNLFLIQFFNVFLLLESPPCIYNIRGVNNWTILERIWFGSIHSTESFNLTGADAHMAGISPVYE